MFQTWRCNFRVTTTTQYSQILFILFTGSLLFKSSIFIWSGVRNNTKQNSKTTLQIYLTDIVICVMYCLYTDNTSSQYIILSKQFKHHCVKIYWFYDEKIAWLVPFPLTSGFCGSNRRVYAQAFTSRIIKELMLSINLSSSLLGLLVYIGNDHWWTYLTHTTIWQFHKLNEKVKVITLFPTHWIFWVDMFSPCS